ncbi:MAG: NUDIX domain-containing protein [Lachnospiraceae bacterium]|nr:NUDIX domain-containing protein [Lachnospiraceae bacterium]
MKMLLVFDEKNYTENMPVFEKYAARAIIIKNGKIAVQHGAMGDYKILGGGIEFMEDHAEALYREVLEESGLFIKREKIYPLGEILEMREDIFQKGVKYVCHTMFYQCDIEEKTTEPHMTQSEIEKGYHLEWVDLHEMVRKNQAFLHQPWIKRDTAFVEMILNGEIALQI